MEKFAPLQIFLDTIKGKAKGPLMVLIGKRPRRYHELRRRFPKLSERILIKQLRELEQDGLIFRHVVGNKAPYSVTYTLSDHGSTLCTVMSAMWKWGEEHAQRQN